MKPPNHTELRIVKDLLRFMFEFVSGVMDQEGNSMNGQNDMTEFRMCVRREMTCYHLRRSRLYVFNLEFDIHLVQFSLNLTLKKCRTSFCVI